MKKELLSVKIIVVMESNNNEHNDNYLCYGVTINKY